MSTVGLLFMLSVRCIAWLSCMPGEICCNVHSVTFMSVIKVVGSASKSSNINLFLPLSFSQAGISNASIFFFLCLYACLLFLPMSLFLSVPPPPPPPLPLSPQSLKGGGGEKACKLAPCWPLNDVSRRLPLRKQPGAAFI